MSGERAPAATAEVRRAEEKKEKDERCMNGWKEYLEQSKELIVPDGGPPRWFSPLECAPRLDSSPLLLFLPGKYFFFSSFYFPFCYSINLSFE